jgi:hypothetical protein
VSGMRIGLYLMAKLQKNKRWKYDIFTDDAEVKWNVHKASVCEGSRCAIHNPSDHPLKNAPIGLRMGSIFSSKPHGFAERFCPCGIGHSDPDSVAFYDSIGYYGTDVHGCCGHCREGLYERLHGNGSSI